MQGTIQKAVGVLLMCTGIYFNALAGHTLLPLLVFGAGFLLVVLP